MEQNPRMSTEPSTNTPIIDATQVSAARLEAREALTLSSSLISTLRERYGASLSLKSQNPAISEAIRQTTIEISPDPPAIAFHDGTPEARNEFSRAYNRFARAYNRFARAYNSFARS
jgi:hypothetical protein